MLDDFRRIIRHLDDLAEQKVITAYTRKLLVEMTNKVVASLAKDCPDIVEEVKNIMGGHVLEYESKTIFREGLREGREEAKLQAMNNLKNVAFRLFKRGTAEDDIAEILDLNIEQITEWMNSYS